MVSFADFLKVSKKDFFNNLDLGMRYPSYVAWAGFYIPDFPEDGSPVSQDLSSAIKDYTRLRIGTPKDIQNLLSLSLAEADADNVGCIRGAINASLATTFKNPEDFLQTISVPLQKYGKTMDIKPILSISTDKTDSNDSGYFLNLLKSGLFTEVHLYGKALLKKTQNFSSFFATARNQGIITSIDAGEAKSSEDYSRLIRFLSPDTISHGEALAKDNELLSLIKKNKISMLVTPDYKSADDTNKKAALQSKAAFIKKIAECDIPLHLVTESVLLFNKSLSQFAADLCNTGLFTPQEVITLIN